MCGIVGYAGGGNAAAQIFAGLQRLEYRGYDSAGMAVMDGGKVSVFKRRGRVEKLAPFAAGTGGVLGIGHTRWATHGKPSDINAHPHTSGRISVVHNGIIENYAELKQGLLKAGKKFLSDTDSEVIACLIDELYSGDLLSAVKECAHMLKGSYALLAICEGKEEIAVAKMLSPVILGRGKNCNMCASDLPALAGICPEVCVLKDGEFALITPQKISVFNQLGGEYAPTIHKNPSLLSDCDKGGYPHFMAKEIFECPMAVRRTAAECAELEDTVRRLCLGADGIIFTGCGTAYHAALLGKRYAEEFCGIPVWAEPAGELRYKKLRITPHTVAVAVTQSGETADTAGAAERIKALGGRVIAVTNCPYSRITSIADCTVPVSAGAEICVAATKSFCGQLAALYTTALCLADSATAKRGKIQLAAMPDIMQKTLDGVDIYALADMCAHSSGVYFLGRDCDYLTALEGSLKLREVSYIQGGGYSAAELKHGTLALIDGSSLCIFIACDGALAPKTASAAEQVLSRGGRVAIITNNAGLAGQFKGRAAILRVPGCPALLSPFITSPVIQLAAYRTAVLLGKDPDMPRNLAKSVTVE